MKKVFQVTHVFFPGEYTVQYFYKIRTCHSNFTVRNFSGVLYALLAENSIPPCLAGPLARVHMENFHLAQVRSRQNQVRYNPGGLARFSYEHVIFLQEFLKGGEISTRRASPPNRASAPPQNNPSKEQTNYAFYRLRQSCLSLI